MKKKSASLLHIGEIHFRVRKETFISSVTRDSRRTIVSSTFPLEKNHRVPSYLRLGKNPWEATRVAQRKVKSGTSCIRRWMRACVSPRSEVERGEKHGQGKRGRRREKERRGGGGGWHNRGGRVRYARLRTFTRTV